MSLLHDRIQFATKMGLIRSGMTALQVLRTIGPPDLVRSHREESCRYDCNIGDSPFESVVQRVWAYGVLGQGGFPALGQVWFDRQGVVLRAYGGGQVGNIVGFTEDGLRQELASLDSLTAISGQIFNPSRFVCTANRLIRLGKSKANAIIREYLRVAPLAICIDFTYPAIAVLIRMIFERGTPIARLPPPSLGGHWFEGRVDVRLFPQFPVAIAGDVPLMLVGDLLLAGRVSVREELLLADEGELRLDEFVPTSCPEQLVDEVWSRLSGSRMLPSGRMQSQVYRMLVNQVLRLVENIYPVADLADSHSNLGDVISVWQAHQNTLRSFVFEWSPSEGRYGLVE